jgi:RNA polymerase-binding transcription factor DksA
MFHLTPSQREILRRRLGERERVLRGEIAEALHPSSRDEPGLANHRAEVDDEVLADLETGIEIAAVVRDAGELNAVLEARARMEAGDYGLCADCRAPIAFERLLAGPEAPRCVRCETERERLRARPRLPAL